MELYRCMHKNFTAVKTSLDLIFLAGALLLVFHNTLLGQANPMFKHISRNDGLSNNRILDITQDKTGFIWIATENGLNRYDGLEFRHYIKTNGRFDISKLFVDSGGELWACSLGGRIYRYNHHSDEFEFVTSKTELSGFSNVNVIHEDAYNVLWFGTDKGLYSYDPATSETHSWIHQPGNENSLTNNNITDILEHIDGNLWISTYGGLNYFNISATRFEAVPANAVLSQMNGDFIYDIEFRDAHNIIMGTSGSGILIYNINDQGITSYPMKGCLQDHGIVRTIFKDSKNTTWVGTDGNGLIRIQESSDQENITCFEKDAAIAGNAIYKVFEDVDKNIWIGTAWNGISIIPSELEGTDFLSSGEGNPPVLSISAIADRIWYGSDGFGLRKGFPGKLYKWEEALVSLVQGTYVQCIYPDSKGSIWIGTFANGLLKFDTASKASAWISTDTRNKLSISFNDVRGVQEDSLGNYWMITAGGGLNYIQVDQQRVTNFRHGRNNPCSLGSDNIQSFILNENGSLWLATSGGGLDYYDYAKRCFKHFVFDSLKTSSINSNYVFSLLDDKKGNLWIGTLEGVCKMDLATHEISRLDLKGLKTGLITSMLLDDHGDIWISSRNGIFYYNTEQDRFSHLTQLNEEYHLSASYKHQDGRLLFGGMKGVTSFYPRQLKHNHQETKLPIVITDLKLFNEPIEPLISTGSGLELTFEYYESVITFDFSALYYPSSSKIEYAVKMENFDQEWRSIGHQRSATYTNLSPGDYQFKVRANLPGADFSESLPVNVVILAPIWKRWWAYALYTVIFALVLWMIICYTQVLEKMKGDLKVEKLKREQEKQLHKIKQRFFTNISHEIRTPVTLLLGAVNSMTKGNEDLEKFSAIKHNGKRLLKLVNELLDLRRLERNKATLKVEKVDLVSFTHDIFLSFNHRANNRNIDYQFLSESKNIQVWLDKDEMEKVLYNLLSNAFKHSPGRGKIAVAIHELESAVELSVSDTGKGIPIQHLSKVFQRFYHIGIDDENSSKDGFGLGLAITHEIVTLHGGEISVSSTTGKGSRFCVTLLKGNAHFPVNYLIPQDGTLVDEIYNLKKGEFPQSMISNIKGSQLLIIDDNSEIRNYLKELLEYDFKITLAENGNQAWELVMSEMPDLVISDVVMPELDGIAFTRTLKENPKTSHIPIILLTARGSDDYHQYSLEIGADDFVTKPFDEDLLKARIINLLNNRYRMKEKIRNELIINPREITPSSTDQQFLHQLITMLDSNIDQGEFSVASLGKNLGMSHSIVYKKLKALTGYNLVEFIRDYRLKKAAQLLASGEVSVKEACFAVGFSDRKYFGAIFKKKFGSNPSNYRKDPRRKTDITRIP